MKMIFVLLAYLGSSIITLELALTIFGIKSSQKKVLFVAILGGLIDYFVKEIITPGFHLYDGIHILTGFLLLSVACYFVLNLSTGGSICIAILSYILSGIGEFLIILFLIAFLGLGFMEGIKDNKFLISVYALMGTATLLIPLFYLKIKNIQLIKLTINK